MPRSLTAIDYKNLHWYFGLKQIDITLL